MASQQGLHRRDDHESLLQVRLDSLDGQDGDFLDDFDDGDLRHQLKHGRRPHHPVAALIRNLLFLGISFTLVLAILAATGSGPFNSNVNDSEYISRTLQSSTVVPTTSKWSSKISEEFVQQSAESIVAAEMAIKKETMTFQSPEEEEAFKNALFNGGPPEAQLEKLPRTSMDYDEVFLDVIREGSIELPSGMMLNIFQNVCVGPDMMAIVARDDVHYRQLKFCCESDEISKHNCTTQMLGLCHSSYAKESIKTEFWPPNAIIENNYLVLPGTSWWMFVPGKTEHIGHNINRMLQLFHARRDPNVPHIDWIVSNRMKLPNGLHNLELVKTVLGNMMTRTWLRKSIEARDDKVLCMERALEVDVATHERTFFTHEQADAWRKYAFANFFPEPKTPLKECPPPKAVVLQRREGTGLRQILNFDVLERVFKRNGIHTYENVSVSGEDDTAGHVKVFSDFGLMIASHSSQLKNTIFAPKNAIVMEVRGTPSGYLEPSPFYWGTDEMSLVFELSQDHTPDLSSCPEAHGCFVVKKYKTDFWLVEELFEKSLQRALKRQAERCGNIWAETAADTQ